MSQHFLYLTNSRMVSMITQGKRIAARREFAVTGAGASEFERYLSSFVDAPTYLFTDLSEEDFRLDTIPHVGSRDREAIVSRKLGQIFRSSPYRYAVMQGREPEGRRDDRVIYTAITNPELLRPWVDAIERHAIPLAGIYSAAVFSSVMLEELDLVFPHTLLVTFTPGQAMRQTYFKDGEIKFSRLTPVDLEEGQTLGMMMAEETTRTWQYLDSLRHFGADDRLEVCVLVHPSDRPAVQPELRDFAQIQYRLVDMEQASMKLGLKPAPLDSTDEEVLVHLFLMRPAANHFASPELRRFSSLRRARIAINQVSVAILVAGILWGGFNFFRALQGNQAEQQVNRDISTLDREYDEITRALPSFGVGGSTMRDTVAFYNSSIRSFPTLADFLVPISQVLQSYPDVQLAQLSWQATDDSKATPAMNLGPPRALPVQSMNKADAPAVAPTTASENKANPPYAGGKFEIALLEASVRVGANDFRGAIDRAQKVSDAIGKLPGYRCEVVESPLDVRSNIAIQGRQSNAEPSTMDTRFVLRVMRERGAT